MYGMIHALGGDTVFFFENLLFFLKVWNSYLPRLYRFLNFHLAEKKISIIAVKKRLDLIVSNTFDFRLTRGGGGLTAVRGSERGSVEVQM